MKYNDINLWFAKDESNNIITIDSVDIEYKDRYYCPICGSEVKAVAPNWTTKEGETSKRTPHFAHFDKSKCSSESMIHFWFKNKFIEVGDKFIINADKKKEYICKSIEVEKSYDVFDKKYNPDTTVHTECGRTIYFEMKNTSGKKIQDYLDIWIGLGNIVVEVDIKDMIRVNESGIREFYALFYDGKCMNVGRNDKSYYDTIGKYKEQILLGSYNANTIRRIKKLDWFWDDLIRYKNEEIDIGDMANLIDCIDVTDKGIVIDVLRKPKCSSVLNEYIDYKVNSVYLDILDYAKNKLGQYSISYEKFKSELKAKPSRRKFVTTGEYGIIYKQALCSSRKESEIAIKNNGQNAFNYYKNKIKDILKEEQDGTNRLKYNQIAKDISLYIDQENIFKPLISELHKDYTLNIRVCNSHDFRYDYCDFSKFKITFEIYYKDNKCVAMSEYIKNIEDLNTLNCIIQNKIQQYIDNLDKVNIDNVKEIIRKIRNKYSKKIKECMFVEMQDVYEDVYLVNMNIGSFQGSFCITNKGITDSFDRHFYARDNIVEQAPISSAMKYIEDNFYNIYCKSCHKDFYLTIEDAIFYTIKGFDSPKRCKKCRNKRKNRMQSIGFY